MSQETWEILKNKEVEGIELQLALQCAPLITGLKIANLLNICVEDFPKMQEIVKNSHISWYLLRQTEQKMTVLLYHSACLENYLKQQGVMELLKKAGYQSFLLEDILDEFCVRYQHYMKDKKNFPHEMGLILGYPVEDVAGFIKYEGNHSLCTGYWKVYENKDKKMKLFESFENAKESLVQLLSYGMRMGDIIDICCHRIGTKTVQINYEKKLIPALQVEGRKIG